MRDWPMAALVTSDSACKQQSCFHMGHCACGCSGWGRVDVLRRVTIGRHRSWWPVAMPTSRRLWVGVREAVEKRGGRGWTKGGG